MKSKDHVLRLARLEGELRSTSDSELIALVDAAGAETKQYLTSVAAPLEGDGLINVAALRGVMSRGRMKGVPDRIMSALTEPCLDACIAALGEKAELPSEADLMAVTPGLVETWGRSTTRLMLASAALSEAPAANAIIKVLRNDPVLALASPVSEVTPPSAVAVLPVA